jgi:PHS family inorganic phosphate transporter-like MFS transporter
VSLGAILGNLLTLVSINRLGRRTIQINGFFWLFVLFLVIGTSYRKLMDTQRSSVLVVLYILTQIFFNFGKYLASAIELDDLHRIQDQTQRPTSSQQKFSLRATDVQHMVSVLLSASLELCCPNAFSGGLQATSKRTRHIYSCKLSVINTMQFVPGLTVVCSFSAFMLIGLVLTVYWIPRSRDKNGQTLTLEELALGRAAVKSE